MQNSLVGTWKLQAFESQSAAGEISEPFGGEAHGLLMYDSHGRMSVILMRADRPMFVSSDPARGTPDEIRAAFEGFSAYYGTYNIDATCGTVTHHVEANSFPNWVGTDQRRFFTLSGRRLTLQAPPMLIDGQTVPLTAVWERVD
jgi:lipocalin-like protein